MCKRKNKQNFSSNNFKYCRIKYQNNLCDKSAAILNDNLNNVKVSPFKTYNNWIKQINYVTKNFIKTSHSYDHTGVFKVKRNCDTFYTGKTKINFKTRCKEHIF